MTGDLIRAMREVAVPIIAGIQGIAAGAGSVVALASDFRIVTTSARFAFLFTKVGLSGGDMGAAYLLPRVVGAGRATQLLMLGDTIDAETADRYGLVSELVPDDGLDAAVDRLARRLADGPTLAYAQTKALITRELDMSLPGAMELDAMTQALLMTTDDHAEFHAAFNERRPPRWTGTVTRDRAPAWSTGASPGDRGRRRRAARRRRAPGGPAGPRRRRAGGGGRDACRAALARPRRRDRPGADRRRPSPGSRASGGRSRCWSPTPAAAPPRRWSRPPTTDWARMLELNLTAPFRLIRRALPAHDRGRLGPDRRRRLGGGQARGGAGGRLHRGQARRPRPGPRRGGGAGAHRRDGQRRLPRLRRHPDDRRDGRRDRGAGPAAAEDDARAVLARRQPIGRLIDPAEVAEAVRFCLVNAAVTGQGINVDGGTVQS